MNEKEAEEKNKRYDFLEQHGCDLLDEFIENQNEMNEIIQELRAYNDERFKGDNKYKS